MPDFAVNPVSLGGDGLSVPDGVSTPPPAATAGLVDAAAGQAGTGASPSYALPPPPFDSVVRFQRALADAGPDAEEPRPTDVRGVAAAPLDKIRTLCGEGMPHVDAPRVDVAPQLSAPQVDAPLPAAPSVERPLPALPRVAALAPAVAPTGEIPSAQSGVLSCGAAATPRTSAGFDAPPPAAPPPFDTGVQSPRVLAEGTPTGEISFALGGVLSRGVAASAVPHMDAPPSAAPSPTTVPPPTHVDVPSSTVPPPFDSGVQSPRVLAEGTPTGGVSSAPGGALSRGAAASAVPHMDAPPSAAPSPTTVPPPAHVDVPVPAVPPAFDSGAQSPRVLAEGTPTGEISSSALGGALSRGAAATPRASAGFDAPPPAAPQSEEPAAPHDVPFALGQPPLEVLSASTPPPVGAAVTAEAAAASARTETLAVTVSSVVEAVATQLLVTPALAQGEGTVRLVLKPDVLDGAIVTLTAQEGTLTVALTTATPKAASIAAAALPQLEVALASHAPAFHHVAVVLTSARKGLSNETT